MPDGSAGCGWAEGVYENEYVLRDGLGASMSCAGRRRSTEGCRKKRSSRPPVGTASERFPPSSLPTYQRDETGAFILPFHYPHPVTGEKTPIG